MASRVPTLLEVCLARAARARGGDPMKAMDVVKAGPYGMRVCSYVIEWAIATVQASEHDVATTVEYAEYWRVTERNGWKHRAAVRELFPGDEFHDVVAAVARSMRARGLTVAELDVAGEMSEPAPAELVAVA